MTDKIVRQLGDAKFQHREHAPVILAERKPIITWQRAALAFVVLGGAALIAMIVVAMP